MPRLSAFFQQPHSKGHAEVNGGQPSELAPLVCLSLVAVLRREMFRYSPLPSSLQQLLNSRGKQCVLVINSSCCLGNCVFSRVTVTWPWRWAPVSLREANSDWFLSVVLKPKGCGLAAGRRGLEDQELSLTVYSGRTGRGWTIQISTLHLCPLATSLFAKLGVNLPCSRETLISVLRKRQKEGQFLYIALASHIPQNCFFKLKGQNTSWTWMYTR